MLSIAPRGWVTSLVLPDADSFAMSLLLVSRQITSLAANTRTGLDAVGAMDNLCIAAIHEQET